GVAPEEIGQRLAEARTEIEPRPRAQARYGRAGERYDAEAENDRADLQERARRGAAPQRRKAEHLVAEDEGERRRIARKSRARDEPAEHEQQAARGPFQDLRHRPRRDALRMYGPHRMRRL